MVERPDGSIELRFEKLECLVRREPRAECLSRRLPELAQFRPSSDDMRCFVEQHGVQGQVVQVLSPAIQVCRSTLNRLVCDRRIALRGDKRGDRAFEQVLVDAAVLIEQSKRRLKAMHERLALRMR